MGGGGCRLSETANKRLVAWVKAVEGAFVNLDAFYGSLTFVEGGRGVRPVLLPHRPNASWEPAKAPLLPPSRLMGLDQPDLSRTRRGAGSPGEHCTRQGGRSPYVRACPRRSARMVEMAAGVACRSSTGPLARRDLLCGSGTLAEEVSA